MDLPWSLDLSLYCLDENFVISFDVDMEKSDDKCLVIRHFLIVLL